MSNHMFQISDIDFKESLSIPLSNVIISIQFSSVAQSCPTLCDPMNHSMPGLPVHHPLPELTQTHVHRVGDAIQPSVKVQKSRLRLFWFCFLLSKLDRPEIQAGVDKSH